MTRLRFLLSVLALLGVLAPTHVLAESRVLSISSPSVTEGDAGTVTATFTVTILCEDPLPSVTIPWQINDGTATTADNDYVDDSGSFGQLCPAPGDGVQVMREVQVLVNGDTDFEPDQTFQLQLMPSVGSPSFTGPLTSNATIENDDPVPVCGNSIVETGEDCDLGGNNGLPNQCCTGTCTFNGGAVCRSTAGVCDAAELCPAASTTCPVDTKLPSTESCRASAGACDVEDFCDGNNNACPADAKSVAQCRVAAGDCDPADFCDGIANTCPTNVLEPATTECRMSAGVCDPAENCTGVDADCPLDLLEPITTECRVSAGICDPAENCDAINVDCPADLLEPATTLCRAGSGDFCDPDELCTGVDPDCPADLFEPATSVCRPAVTQGCDITEFCTGIPGEMCPADAMQGRCTCGPND